MAYYFYILYDLSAKQDLLLYCRVKNYRERKSEMENIDQSLIGDLSQTEQFLLKMHDLMEIRGKVNEMVKNHLCSADLIC